MYQAETSAALLKKRLKLPGSRLSWLRVERTVFLLGATSLFTDISAEMVATTLPIYLLVTLHLSPFQVGLTDGIYQGAAVLVKVISGVIADRWRRPKDVAAVGYGLSALCRLGLLGAGGNWGAISASISLDRVGKGIRTAPRDAMIAASTQPDQLATAFGVHRAMDTAGAMLGPLLAVVILSVAHQGYDAVFVVSLCVALIGVAVIVLFVDNPKDVVHDADAIVSAGSSQDKPTVTWRRMVGLLEQADFRNLVGVGSLLALVTVSDSLLYLMLQQRVRLNDGMFPLLYVGTALAFMLLAIPLGRLADRIGHESMFLLGYGVLVAVYGLLLLPHPNLLVVLVALLALGSYYAATDGVLMALASRQLPADLRATGLAVLTTGTGLARLLASALYGSLWGWYGAQGALTVFVSGLVVALWVTRRTVFRVART